jgi:hypothetical protein
MEEVETSPVIPFGIEEESAEAMKKADDILRCGKPLEYIPNTLTKLGLIGETDSALLAYLSGLTNLMPDWTLNLLMTGLPRSGKDFTLDRVAKLYPEGIVNTFTRITGGAFEELVNTLEGGVFYLKDLRSKQALEDALKIFTGGDKQNIARLEQINGMYTYRSLGQKGRFSVWISTAYSDIDSQLGARFLFCKTDESDEQTKAIITEQINKRKFISEYKKKTNGVDFDLMVAHNMYNLLKKQEVSGVEILFGESIKEDFSTNSRVRLDQFMHLVEIITFLHGYQREKVDIDGEIYLRATLADYLFAKAIIQRSYDLTNLQLTRRQINVLESIYRLTLSGQQIILPNHVQDNTGFSTSVVYRCLSQLSKHGLIQGIDKHNISQYPVDPDVLLGTGGRSYFLTESGSNFITTNIPNIPFRSQTQMGKSKANINLEIIKQRVEKELNLIFPFSQNHYTISSIIDTTFIYNIPYVFLGKWENQNKSLDTTSLDKSSKDNQFEIPILELESIGKWENKADFSDLSKDDKLDFIYNNIKEIEVEKKKISIRYSGIHNKELHNKFIKFNNYDISLTSEEFDTMLSTLVKQNRLEYHINMYSIVE